MLLNTEIYTVKVTVTFSFSKHNIWKTLRNLENKEISEHCVKNPIAEGSRGYKNKYKDNNVRNIFTINNRSLDWTIFQRSLKDYYMV